MRRNEKDCAETVPYEIRVAPDSCLYTSCLMPAAALLLKSATVPVADRTSETFSTHETSATSHWALPQAYWGRIAFAFVLHLMKRRGQTLWGVSRRL